jgi:DNA-binding transcriptional LysR family regulator
MEWVMSEGSPPPSFSTCNNIAVIARLVSAGVAVGILPTCILRSEIEAGTVMRYDAIPPLAPRSICAAFATSSRGPGFDALLAIAHEAADNAGLSGR